MSNNLKWVFFGTGDVSVSVLNDLEKEGLLPSLVVTTPDKPQGRKLVITPSPVKIWALEKNIEILQPEKIDGTFINSLKKEPWELFIVVAYGKIIPKEVLEIPTHKSLNIHYSLLPRLRGSSPVEGAILQDERETGVSIILMDEKMDHGPILAQEKVETPAWPPTRTELMNIMNDVAGKLLATVIPKWIKGEIEAIPQDHSKATFVKMINKEDGLVDLADEPYTNYKKIMAYERWPRAYFMDKGRRVIINKASWNDGNLKIEKVTPESKKEMSYEDYLGRIV